MTRWPVSAAWIAESADSGSRISPMKITSGSWRITCLSAAPYESVSIPTSRCCDDRELVLVHDLDRVLDRHDVRTDASR